MARSVSLPEISFQVSCQTLDEQLVATGVGGDADALVIGLMRILQVHNHPLALAVNDASRCCCSGARPAWDSAPTVKRPMHIAARRMATARAGLVAVMGFFMVLLLWLVM